MAEKKRYDSDKRADAKYKNENTVMKGVRFFPADMELLEHAKNQGPFMTYVKSLIRADMEAQK